MQLAVSYAASAPDLIKPDYRLPPDSADRPLRIWTRDAMNREPASVTAGGSFVPAGRFTNLTALGFDESKRTVELYVEGIHTTAGVSQPISIQLFVGDRLTSTDLVSVSVVSNVLVIGIDGTDTRPWLTGPNAKRPNGLWNSHVRNLIADVEPYAMTIYRYGPVWTGTDSDDIQRDVVARANEIIRDAGGGTKVALVGWSRGAMIALWAANELSGPAAQVGGMQRTVEFVGLYDPVDMATAIPSDEHVRGENAARIQPGIRRVMIVGPKETPNNNVDYPVGLPSYWTGLILTPDPIFVRMAQNDRITALGATTVVDRIEYNASHGAIGGCPGYNVHLVSIPDGDYSYADDRRDSILSDTDIRNGMRAAGLDFVPDRGDPDEDWYGFPATRPING
jgi:pimeloyl-ACP methyl ester carboxylesterase